MAKDIPEKFELIFDILKDSEARDPRDARCATCKYAAFNPGTHHIKCARFKTDVMMLLSIAFPSITFTFPGTNADVEIPIVGGSKHAIKNGWFVWPFNFDQIWLRWCFMWKEKEVKNE